MIYARDELYTMPAGRDLDAAVATTLFGWQDGEIPHYSTRMDDAWLVVAHLRDLWTAATANVGNRDDFPRPFADAEFFEHLHRHADRRWPWAMLYMTADAICRAALLSVIEEEAQQID